MKRRALLVIVLLLAGCAASGGAFSPVAVEPGKGVIYIYTLDDTDQQGALVVLDGREVGTLRPLGHLKFPVEAGQHTLSVTVSLLFVVPVKQKPLDLDVKPGDSLYVRVDGFRGFTLTQMPADIAREEIRTTRMSSG